MATQQSGVPGLIAPNKGPSLTSALVNAESGLLRIIESQGQPLKEDDGSSHLSKKENTSDV
jgi:hypothetical protein